jgi:hypothetical protein
VQEWSSTATSHAGIAPDASTDVREVLLTGASGCFRARWPVRHPSTERPALARFCRQCFHIPSTLGFVSWMKCPVGRASSWISPLWPGGPRHMVRLARRGQRKRTGEARGDPRSAAGPVGRAARRVRTATAGPGAGRPRSHQGWLLSRSKPFGSRFLRAFPCAPRSSADSIASRSAAEPGPEPQPWASAATLRRWA